MDDEEQIRRALRSILAARRYDVVLAGTGEEGINMATRETPDLVVLDLALPDKSGMEICREMRTWLSAPILVLSVRGGEGDKIAALDAGADDYLTKPFSAGELLARIRALLRRSSGQPPSEPVIRAGELEIDIPRRRVYRNGEEIRLTRTEFDILAYLAQNASRVVTTRMILQQVWGPEYGNDTQTLRVHVGHLRKKIEPHPSVPRYVLTEPGVGYRFSPA